MSGRDMLDPLSTFRGGQVAQAANSLEHEVRKPPLTDKNKWIRSGIMGALARGRVLVVGSERPEVGLCIAAFGHSVISAVRSAEAMKLGAETALGVGLPCRFGLAEGAALPFPDNTFDTVVLTEIPERLRMPHPFVEEAFRVCRPDGRIIVSVPNVDDEIGEGKVSAYSRRGLAKLLEQHGARHLHWSPGVPRPWLLTWLDRPKIGAKADVMSVTDLEDYLSLSPPPTLPQCTELVTVLVATFNRAHLLRRTLDAIYAQTYRNLEVIVIDDGSTDHTADVVSRHPGRPRYLRKANGGKASALNIALPLVRAQYIWIADDDDLPLPYKVAQQVQVLKANPDAGMVYSAYYSFQGAPRNILHYQYAQEFAPGMQMPTLLDLGHPTGPTSLCRASAIRSVGQFDETLIRSQDLDMWIRLARRFQFQWFQFPTLLKREHAGLRGSATARFSPEHNQAKWLAYNQRIYRKVYWTFGLSEVDPRAGDGTDRNRVAAALVFRAKVMLKRALVEDACCDLRQAARELERADGSLTGDARTTVLEDVLELDGLATDRGSNKANYAAHGVLKIICREYSMVLPGVLDYMATQVKGVKGMDRIRYIRRGLGLLPRDPSQRNTWRILAHVLGRSLRAIRLRVFPLCVNPSFPASKTLAVERNFNRG